MSTSQRLSRGFHRLGLFLAAVPLLVGGTIAISSAIGEADSASRKYQKLLCAHQYIVEAQKLVTSTNPNGIQMAYEAALKLCPGKSLSAAGSQHGTSPGNPFADLIPKEKKSLTFEAQRAIGALDRLILRYAYECVFSPDDDARLNLKKVGCSESEYESVSYGEARNPAKFNWLSAFAPPAALGLVITLAVTFAVYGLVWAIGWVIGGFAAS